MINVIASISTHDDCIISNNEAYFSYFSYLSQLKNVLNLKFHYFHTLISQSRYNLITSPCYVNCIYTILKESNLFMELFDTKYAVVFVFV